MEDFLRVYLGGNALGEVRRGAEAGEGGAGDPFRDWTDLGELRAPAEHDPLLSACQGLLSGPVHYFQTGAVRDPEIRRGVVRGSPAAHGPLRRGRVGSFAAGLLGRQEMLEVRDPVHSAVWRFVLRNAASATAGASSGR